MTPDKQEGAEVRSWTIRLGNSGYPLAQIHGDPVSTTRVRVLEAEPVVDLLHRIMSDLERNGTVTSAHYNEARALLSQLQGEEER